MSGTQGAQPIPLGQGRAYLWRSSNGSGMTAIISAHGSARQRSGSRAFRPDRLGPQLEFFCPHGEAMEDEGIMRYFRNREPPIEVVQANQAPDYLLTKYTNSTNSARGRHRHNQAGESYSGIQALVTTPSSGVGHYADRAAMFGMAGNQESLSLLLDQAFNTRNQPDIITISGRMFGNGVVRLSDLLMWLETAGIRYQRISCSFCRSINPYITSRVSEMLFREQ